MLISFPKNGQPYAFIPPYAAIRNTRVVHHLGRSGNRINIKLHTNVKN